VFYISAFASLCKRQPTDYTVAHTAGESKLHNVRASRVRDELDGIFLSTLMSCGANVKDAAGALIW
jgi:hypothetical protein